VIRKKNQMRNERKY